MCQCLHEIWFQGILQQGGHCTFCTQILCIDRIPIQIISNQNLSQPPLHICQIRSQTENCHDFRSNGNLESVRTWNPVDFSAQTNDNVPQSTVIHIQNPLKHHSPLVNPQNISLLHMVVQHRTEQIIGCGDGVHIACKVQVDVLHRNNLRIATASSTALDTENRT